MKTFVLSLDHTWAGGKKLYVKANYDSPESLLAQIRQYSRSVNSMLLDACEANSSPASVARLESTMRQYGFIGPYSVGYVDRFLVKIEEYKQPDFIEFV